MVVIHVYESVTYRTENVSWDQLSTVRQMQHKVSGLVDDVKPSVGTEFHQYQVALALVPQVENCLQPTLSGGLLKQ